LKDVYQVDLKTYQFTKLVLDESEMLLPVTEMHTSHIYKNSELLILGGRAMPANAEKLEDIQFTDQIVSINLQTKKVTLFGRMPTALGSHVSMLIDDKYILVYGGTNGYRFFDSLMRYDIAKQKWELMMKYPDCFQGSTFFTDGRIASSSC